MAKRKKVKSASKPRAKKYTRRAAVVGTRNSVSVFPSATIPEIKWVESYTSLLLGILAVLVVAFGLVSFVKSKKFESIITTNSVVDQVQPPKEKVVTAPGETVQNKTTVLAPPSDSYIVQDGDNLWDISEKMYHSGYNWTDIAKANKLENPGLVYAGTKLSLPKVEAKILAASTTSNMVQAPPAVENAQPQVVDSYSKITGDTYVVVHGDDLWDIAVRAYGDGFRWMDIAKANNLSNPSLIHGDNVLKIPR